MQDRLDELLVAVRLSFPMSANRSRAARILENALAELVNEARPTDALGAPRRPHIITGPTIGWDELRAAVRHVIHEIGIEAFAERYGSASPDSVLDVINRRKEPGIATKTRMLRVVTGNFSQ
jgi:hypothetical protein